VVSAAAGRMHEKFAVCFDRWPELIDSALRAARDVTAIGTSFRKSPKLITDS
jgi:hypothetical protein